VRLYTGRIKKMIFLYRKDTYKNEE